MHLEYILCANELNFVQMLIICQERVNIALNMYAISVHLSKHCFVLAGHHRLSKT